MRAGAVPDRVGEPSKMIERVRSGVVVSADALHLAGRENRGRRQSPVGVARTR